MRWEELAIYELSPELVGEFDFAFIGSLLLHPRDPVAALASVRSVLKGELLSVDAISPLLTALHPNQPPAFLNRMESFTPGSRRAPPAEVGPRTSVAQRERGQVKLVIRCSSATRAEISSRVKRATRSVPNSSTL